MSTSITDALDVYCAGLLPRQADELLHAAAAAAAAAAVLRGHSREGNRWWLLWSMDAAKQNGVSKVRLLVPLPSTI
ncbi:hypothetical protein AAL_06066 [Moelleriella libera RCEF 2490]|uniref:Uncharacterized protein n=1 Tax=Moelleriella libera RCEF 2490 TaxID=1081109 RepID=A0A166NU85_9HYPO|nr:hypothetical protein AAL_06066 [Moelleriella libera RCEF 2490]